MRSSATHSKPFYTGFIFLVQRTLPPLDIAAVPTWSSSTCHRVQRDQLCMATNKSPVSCSLSSLDRTQNGVRKRETGLGAWLNMAPKAAEGVSPHAAKVINSLASGKLPPMEASGEIPQRPSKDNMRSPLQIWCDGMERACAFVATAKRDLRHRRSIPSNFQSQSRQQKVTRTRASDPTCLAKLAIRISNRISYSLLFTIYLDMSRLLSD